MKLNKLVFAALATFTIGSLASCGGSKSTFSLNVDDPVLNYSEMSRGFKITIAEGYKIEGRPDITEYKFNCDKGNKMRFEVGPFDRDDPSKAVWKAYPEEVGTYKVSLSIQGVRSTNELTLTVKESRYPEFSFKLPENIHLTYKDKDGDDGTGLYKIDNKYCGHGTVRPWSYIPNINNNLYYTNHKDSSTGEYFWRKVERSPLTLYNTMTALYRSMPDTEYIDKTEGTVTIGGKTYSTVSYNFGHDTVYDCIIDDNISIVYRKSDEKDPQTKNPIYTFEVTTIDTSVTKMPDSFNLPE